MGERTAAEVLAGKLSDALSDTVGVATESWGSSLHLQRAAARLAEDPAIAVRTDLVVERFVVERHRSSHSRGWRSAAEIHNYLTSTDHLDESADDRIVVRPYPEESS